MHLRPARKNILLYVSLFVYLVSVCGIQINRHFCGGELEQVSLLAPDACCEGETPEAPDDCCSNESVYLANKAETLGSKEVSLELRPAEIEIIASFVFQLAFADDVSIRKDFWLRPPRLENELVARIMVLRI